MKSLIISTVLILSGCASTAATKYRYAKDSTLDTISVMVLGSHHFAGGSSDVLEMDVVDVLSDRRQSELQAIATAMATFNPTVVITERETREPDYIDPKFLDFDDSVLNTNKNERVQLAYRIARQANITRVYGIDEQTSEGEPQYFPFGKLVAHVEATGQKEAFDADLAAMQVKITVSESSASEKTLAESLIELNTGSLSAPDIYYQLMKYDKGENQPAAELQAYYFMRNAKIFSKIHDVTKAGDRVIIVYGAGHKFWLEHFVSQTPGFELVNPIPYLEAAETY